MSNLATRLITLILLLQSRPNQKASELSEKLGISVRTLHRYFDTLDEMGIPVYAERGPYGGFSLVRGYKIPPLVFSLEEAVAVYLGSSLVGEMWGDLYRLPAQGALAKLENILPNEQRSEVEWARRSLVVTNLHRSDPTPLAPTLEGLRRAAREQRRISIQYRGVTKPGATTRKVDPYALVFNAGWWYLVGYCHLRKAPRTFRVDRIQRCTLLEQSFDLPEGFDIHAYLANEFKDQPLQRAQLRFSPEAASFVTGNRHLWESLKENPDGGFTAILSAPDLPWLASMVMSFASWVTVLDPPELRVMVKDWAQAIVNQYKVI